jgi:hypothetical protein
MASEVDIVNVGLVQLGAARINSLLDNVKAAREARAIYEFNRDAEIESHKWKFAIRLASLPALVDGPVWTTTFRLLYQLPNDFLRLEMAGDLFPGASLTDYRNGPDQDYAIQNGQIATNLPAPLNIRYVARVTDPTEFDPLFVMVLGYRMGMALAETLTQSTDKAQAAAAAYGSELAQAVKIGAVQDPPKPIADSQWILSRI